MNKLSNPMNEREIAIDLIRKMPKVETHVHLDGSLTLSTIKKLVEQQQYVPLMGLTDEELYKLTVCQVPQPLVEVLQYFFTIHPLLKSREAMEYISYKLIQQSSLQNIKHIEVRLAPCFHSTDTFTMNDVMESVSTGLKRGCEEYKITYGIIICLIRPFVPMSTNLAMTELAILLPDVVGIDVAGDEAAQPLSEFMDLLLMIKSAGKYVTVHAGETESSDLQSCFELDVDRIGHATTLINYPELLSRCHVPIEINMTSNIRTKAITQYASHPVRKYYDMGLIVTISTDDPGIFDTSLSDEYIALYDTGFTLAELKKITYNGIDALFVDKPTKDGLRRAFDMEFIQLSLLR
jgi:adenosine deaminase